MINKKILITGRVQGVGFRFSTQVAAKNYGINGYVKNLADGTVFIEAEGEDENINQFITWCWKGPAYSIVSNLKVENGDIKNYKYFDIKF